MNINAFRNTLASRLRALPVVILYVTEACNLRCVMCSYREAQPGELSIGEIRSLADVLCSFGLRQIVFSGGEPLVRRDLPEICTIFRERGIRQTLLTNGALLKKRLGELKDFFSEVIISLDGPTARIHDEIRGSKSFDLAVAGIREMKSTGFAGSVSIRTVLQKKNFHAFDAMVDLARNMGVDRISFLAADVLSGAFGRPTGADNRPDAFMLDRREIQSFRTILTAARDKFKKEFDTGFISESPDRLMRIAQYYEALEGSTEFPRNVCNAPMVSAVITSTGDILPCFFLGSYGNLRKEKIPQLVNMPAAIKTRKEVRDYTLDRCHTCVCTLSVSPLRALVDSF
ncbi:MAG TPA: radical SAM protein [Bacteroidota bacterium]|nr:radical SAM protein [Bacteroidota bacterium]